MSTWTFAKTLVKRQFSFAISQNNFSRDCSLHTQSLTQRKPPFMDLLLNSHILPMIEQSNFRKRGWNQTHILNQCELMCIKMIQNLDLWWSQFRKSKQASNAADTIAKLCSELIKWNMKAQSSGFLVKLRGISSPKESACPFFIPFFPLCLSVVHAT